VLILPKSQKGFYCSYRGSRDIHAFQGSWLCCWSAVNCETFPVGYWSNGRLASWL